MTVSWRLLLAAVLLSILVKAEVSETGQENANPQHRPGREETRHRSEEGRVQRGQDREQRVQRGQAGEERVSGGQAGEERVQRGQGREERVLRGQAGEERVLRGQAGEERVQRGQDRDQRVLRGQAVEVSQIEEEILLNLTQSGPPRPGFKGRITQSGLDYASNVTTKLLMRALRKLTIPDVQERMGPAKVSVFNVNVTRFPDPVTRLSLLPGQGLRLTAIEIEPLIDAQYDAEIKIAFWKIYKEGVVKMQGHNLSFALDFFIGGDENGRPTVEVIGCEATGIISTTFTGGWSEGLNIGSTIFRDNIRSLIYEQLCEQTTKEINEKTAWALERFSVTERIENEYELDFHLTQYPEFFGDALETYHKGVIYLLREDGGHHEPPFGAPPIPLYHAHDDKMVYVYVTNYLLNSAFYAAYRSGKMAINITRNQVPVEARQYVTMTCESVCLGTVFPQLARAYPNAIPSLRIYATGSPHISFREGHVIFNAAMNTELHADEEDGREHLLTIHVNVTSKFSVYLNNRKVTFNITDISPVAAITHSKVNLGENLVFQSMVRFAVNSFLKPKLAELGAKGFDLPDLKDVRFVNPEIIVDSQVQDILVIATDVHYDGKL